MLVNFLCFLLAQRLHLLVKPFNHCLRTMDPTVFLQFQYEAVSSEFNSYRKTSWQCHAQEKSFLLFPE